MPAGRTRGIVSTVGWRGVVLGLVLLVLGSSAALWSQHAAAPRPADPPPATARGTALTQRVADHTLQLVVAPARVGPNRLLLALRDGHSRLVRGARVTLTLVMQDMAMGQTVLPASPVRDGRYQALGTLSMPGHWEVAVAAHGPGLPPGGLHASFHLTAQIAASAVVPTALPLAAGAAPATEPRDPASSSVRWTSLPQRAAVSFVDNGMVYVPGAPALIRLGPLNHSVVRAPDGTLWVTNVLSNTVSVLDPVRGRLLTRIPVGLYPVHIAFTPDGRRAYVTNFYSHDVSVVDVPARRVVATVAVGLEPHGLVVTPDGREMWIPCSLNGGMWIVNTRTNRVGGIVPTGLIPHAAAVAPDGKTVYMTDSSAGTLLVVDRARRRVRGRVVIGTGSAMVVVGRDGRRVYVSGQGGHVVTVVDARSLRILRRIAVGGAPHGMALTHDGRWLYVAANTARHVAVVDTRTERVVAAIRVPGAADELALLPR